MKRSEPIQERCDADRLAGVKRHGLERRRRDGDIVHAAVKPCPRRRKALQDDALVRVDIYPFRRSVPAFPNLPRQFLAEPQLAAERPRHEFNSGLGWIEYAAGRQRLTAAECRFGGRRIRKRRMPAEKHYRTAAAVQDQSGFPVGHRQSRSSLENPENIAAVQAPCSFRDSEAVRDGRKERYRRDLPGVNGDALVLQALPSG